MGNGKVGKAKKQEGEEKPLKLSFFKYFHLEFKLILRCFSAHVSPFSD